MSCFRGTATYVLRNQIPIDYNDENYEYDDENGDNYDAFDDDNDQKTFRIVLKMTERSRPAQPQ